MLLRVESHRPSPWDWIVFAVIIPHFPGGALMSIILVKQTAKVRLPRSATRRTLGMVDGVGAAAYQGVMKPYCMRCVCSAFLGSVHWHGGSSEFIQLK